VIAVRSERSNNHGLPGRAVNPQEIPPFWRDMDVACAPPGYPAKYPAILAGSHSDRGRLAALLIARKIPPNDSYPRLAPSIAAAGRSGMDRGMPPMVKRLVN